MISRVKSLAILLAISILAVFANDLAVAAPFTNGEILVVGGNVIYRVDPNTGTRTALASGGNLNNDTRSAQFETSTSVIAVNGAGQVIRISDTGSQTLVTTLSGSSFRDFLLTPDNQYIYAGDIGSDEEIWRYTFGSNTWQKLTPGAPGDGSNYVGGRTYFDEPYQPQLSGTNLFVTERDSSSGQLVKVDLTGTAPNMAQTVLNTGGGRRGLELFSNGDLIATNNPSNSIQRYTQAGALVGTISSSPTNGTLIAEPYHLVWQDNSYSTLLLADSTNGLIKINFATGAQTLLGPASGIFGVDVYLEAAETVPEPSTYALGLIGLAGLGLVAGRKRRASRSA